MSAVVGVAGVIRNASFALCTNGRVLAACEQERLSRTRRAGLPHGRIPTETLEAILQIGGLSVKDISAFAVAETGVRFPPDMADMKVERLDHHYGHAATAFYTSSFSDALVL